MLPAVQRRSINVWYTLIISPDVLFFIGVTVDIDKDHDVLISATRLFWEASGLVGEDFPDCFVPHVIDSQIQ